MDLEMKKIAILSGKGGVGKSSIAASLAIALKKKKIVLVDTDADCPNLHILFKGKIKSSKVLQAAHTAQIDYSKCINCGKCAEVCKFSAFEFKDKPIVNKFFCEGCGACTAVCPQSAISIIPVDSGELKVVDTKEGFPLVYGQLYPGKAGSGKIVHDVRAVADNIAKKENAEIILIDSAAGIGCPVIASILGCDYVIGVVEPNQASERDLSRALEMVEYFKIPYGIVLNKTGISEKNETRIKKLWKNKILLELPYDPEIPKLLAERKAMIYKKEFKKKLVGLAEELVLDKKTRLRRPGD